MICCARENMQCSAQLHAHPGLLLKRQSVRWLLLLCIVKGKNFSCFITYFAAAAPHSLFHHEGPHAKRLTQLFAFADWGRYQKRWSGTVIRKGGDCGLGFAGTLCVSSPMQVPRGATSDLPRCPLCCAHVLTGSRRSGTAASVPQYRGVTVSSAQILHHLYISRVWWYTSSCTSQYWETFQKQHMYGGDGVEGERGEGSLNCLLIKICSCCLWLILI